MTPIPIAQDGVAYPFEDGGQRWVTTWHRPPAPPQGIRNGSSAIAVTQDGHLILISEDGARWDFPGGRPEGDETWEATLHRELAEEACATMPTPRLLGFARGECTHGPEAGRVIVRAFFAGAVLVHPWHPQFETAHRRFVPPSDLLRHTFRGFAPIYQRLLVEAGLLPA